MDEENLMMSVSNSVKMGAKASCLNTTKDHIIAITEDIIPLPMMVPTEDLRARSCVQKDW
jgi:hypothetical protein